MSEQAKCELCGEPMPPGEDMFKYHGYSGDCPKPPLQHTHQPTHDDYEKCRSWRASNGVIEIPVDGTFALWEAIGGFNDPNHARLAAAAPEMFAACKAALNSIGHPMADPGVQEAITLLKSAIAKVGVA